MSGKPAGGTADSNWLWGGIVAALFVPPIGFIIAIIVFAKGRVAHGMAILLTCVVGAMLGMALVCGAAVDGIESDLADVADAPAEPVIQETYVGEPLTLANDAGRLRVTVSGLKDPLTEIDEYDEPMAGAGFHYVAVTVSIKNLAGRTFNGYLDDQLVLASGRKAIADDQPYGGPCSAVFPLDDLRILPGRTSIVCVPYVVKDGAVIDEAILTLPSDDIFERHPDVTGSWLLSR